MKKLLDTELRIGNIVLDSTKTTTVVETIVPGHERVRYGKKLTPTILVHFGFVLLRDLTPEEVGFVLYDEDPAKHIYIRTKCKPKLKGFFTLFNHCSCKPSELQFLRKVEFVHQVQNLLFDLGKEIKKT